MSQMRGQNSEILDGILGPEGTVRINQGGELVTLKKSGFRNRMTPINVSSFFYDPLKLEDQKTVTLP